MPHEFLGGGVHQKTSPGRHWLRGEICIEIWPRLHQLRNLGGLRGNIRGWSEKKEKAGEKGISRKEFRIGDIRGYQLNRVVIGFRVKI